MTSFRQVLLRKKYHVIMLSILASLMMTSSESFSASFDYSKSKTFIEKTICGDPGLSQMDGTLNTAYKNALKKSIEPEKLKKEQREWIQKERNGCSDIECLKLAYENRIKYLGNIADSYQNLLTLRKILPKEYTVIAAGGISGYTVNYTRNNEPFYTEQMDVSINVPEKPVVLLLTACNPTVWNIKWTKETKICAVSITGVSRQAVGGLDRSIPVLMSRGCFMQNNDDKASATFNTALLNTISNQVTGKNPDSTYLAINGKIMIGKPIVGETRWITSTTNTPESYYDTKPPLSGRPGFDRQYLSRIKMLYPDPGPSKASIDEAIRNGVIRKATENDLKDWINSLENERQRHLIPGDNNDAIDMDEEQNFMDIFNDIKDRSNSYIVLKPFSCPIPNHKIYLFISKGVPAPKSLHPNLAVFDFNRFTDKPCNDLIQCIIRKNPRLSGLYDRMVKAYRAMLFDTPDIENLMDSQSTWGQNTREKCNDEVCLKHALEKRLGELDNGMVSSSLENEIKTLSLPKDYVILAAGGHSERKTGKTYKDKEETINETVMDVNIKYPKKPVVLILAANHPRIWNIQRDPGSQLKAVLVCGDTRHKVNGLDSSIPLVDFAKSMKKNAGHLVNQDDEGNNFDPANVDIENIEKEYKSVERFSGDFRNMKWLSMLDLNITSRRAFGKPVDLVYFAINNKVVAGEDSQNAIKPGPADGGLANYELPVPAGALARQRTVPSDIKVILGDWKPDDPVPMNTLGPIHITGQTLSWKKNDFFTKNCTLSFQVEPDTKKAEFEYRIRQAHNLGPDASVMSLLLKITGDTCTGSNSVRLTLIEGKWLHMVEYDNANNEISTMYFVRGAKKTTGKKR